MGKFALLWLLCWLGIASMAQAEPTQHWNVGLHRLVFADPLGGRAMHALGRAGRADLSTAGQ
ncbi:hypothetical protein [Pseudomonas fluorescens]|uniref:hypothetical protein n=1 Tax=Pseudomonas fluorescens TaxID=294 RepID=UPI00178586C9|nr:hypothetical protein [Pseudomonas fluorescens]